MNSGGGTHFVLLLISRPATKSLSALMASCRHHPLACDRDLGDSRAPILPTEVPKAATAPGKCRSCCVQQPVSSELLHGVKAEQAESNILFVLHAVTAAGVGGCVSVRVNARVVFSSGVHETFCYSSRLLPPAMSFQSTKRNKLFSSSENNTF